MDRDLTATCGAAVGMLGEALRRCNVSPSIRLVFIRPVHEAGTFRHMSS